MVRVEIDRTKWSRGEMGSNALVVGPTTVRNAADDSGGVGLQPVSTHMCCLGFACQALGIPIADMVDVDMPRGLGVPLPGLTTDDGRDSDFSRSAAALNDRHDDLNRERDLAALASANGFEFIFIN